MTNDRKRIQTSALYGSDIESLCGGNARLASRELGWNRKTLSKALAELRGGFCYIDNYAKRGRKKPEVHLPNLKRDIKEIVDSESQTDPTFRTQGSIRASVHQRFAAN